MPNVSITQSTVTTGLSITPVTANPASSSSPASRYILIPRQIITNAAAVNR